MFRTLTMVDFEHALADIGDEITDAEEGIYSQSLSQTSRSRLAHS